MIHYSQEEKDRAKQARKEYKKNSNSELKKQSYINQKSPILTGWFKQDERLLEDNYPIYQGYCYVVKYKNNEFKVLISEIGGCVHDLKMKYTNIINVYKCSLYKRNLL